MIASNFGIPILEVKMLQRLKSVDLSFAYLWQPILPNLKKCMKGARNIHKIRSLTKKHSKAVYVYDIAAVNYFEYWSYSKCSLETILKHRRGNCTNFE